MIQVSIAKIALEENGIRSAAILEESIFIMLIMFQVSSIIIHDSFEKTFPILRSLHQHSTLC